jgi:hypothetical protein
MADLHVQCISALREFASNRKFWKDHLGCLRTANQPPFGIHLAVFVEPFLKFILDGQKTVESRFSVVKCAPYDRVKEGDVILLKRVAGPVVGLCRVSSASFYELDKANWQFIRDKFAKAICADDDFWASRCHAVYATLLTVTDPVEIRPFNVAKKDRRGWVVVTNMTPGTNCELFV